ncbi:hypothetical protein D3C77_687690 [compost metagenome]
MEFVPIPNPKFVTLEGDPTKKHEAELLWCREEGNYVRFVVTSEQLEAWEKIIPDGLQYKVELRKEYQQEEERSGVKIGMGFEEIVTQYAEEKRPDALEEGLELIRGSIE